MTNRIKKVAFASKEGVKHYSLDSAEIQYKQGKDYKPSPPTLNWLGIFFIVLFSVLSLGIFLIVCAVYETWLLPKFCFNIPSRTFKKARKPDPAEQLERNEDRPATPPKDQDKKTPQPHEKTSPGEQGALPVEQGTSPVEQGALPEEQALEINTDNSHTAPAQMRGTIITVHTFDNYHDILRNFHPESHGPFGESALPRLTIHEDFMRNLYTQPSRLYFDQTHGFSPSLQLNPYLPARQFDTTLSLSEIGVHLSNTRGMRQLLNLLHSRENLVANYFGRSQNPYFIPSISSNSVIPSDTILPPSILPPASFEQNQAHALREIESGYTPDAHSFALLNSQIALQPSFMQNQAPVLTQEPTLEEVEEIVDESNALPKEKLVLKLRQARGKAFLL
ncbi:MAG: hypothetical protein VXW87_01150 [Pseudomonadota bacterium]|nr:hypothetical protein [Pseudomonadota bacterium]